MSNSDASLSKRTCFFAFHFLSIFFSSSSSSPPRDFSPSPPPLLRSSSSSLNLCFAGISRYNVLRRRNFGVCAFLGVIVVIIVIVYSVFKCVGFRTRDHPQDFLCLKTPKTNLSSNPIKWYEKFAIDYFVPCKIPARTSTANDGLRILAPLEDFKVHSMQ